MPADTARPQPHDLLADADDLLTVDDPDRLRRRITLLDQLEEHLERDRSDARLLNLRAALEAANERVADVIRAEVRRGHGRAAMTHWLGIDWRSTDVDARDGYDHLDAIVADALRLDEPADPSVERTPEMVFYQPTPMRHVIDLLRRTALAADDVLVDLGAGLGHVAIMASICTEARVIGIEVEPAYVECARKVADELGLTTVQFIESDARDVSFDEGTVFFLYTPFSGGILRAVLDALWQQAERRPIRVCSYGPCTPTIADEAWLAAASPEDGKLRGRVAVFESTKLRHSV